MIDRKEIKLKSKDLCKTAKPSLITMGLIYTLLSGVIGALSSAVLGGNITQQDFNRLLYAYNDGNYDVIIKIVEKLRPTPSGSLISALLSVVMWIVAAGFVIFIMNTVRGTGAAYGNILDGFGITGRVLILNLIEGIVTALLFCLLVVPGIIYVYSHRLSTYIMIDHPEMSVLECLKESKRLMKGHKWELFVMDLSFLGWLLLSAVFPVAGIFVSPYTQTAYFIYYQNLIHEAH